MLKCWLMAVLVRSRSSSERSLSCSSCCIGYRLQRKHMICFALSRCIFVHLLSDQLLRSYTMAQQLQGLPEGS